jgi:hypothetical protein
MESLIQTVWRHEVDYVQGIVRIFKTSGELVATIGKYDTIPELEDLPIWFLREQRKKFDGKNHEKLEA